MPTVFIVDDEMFLVELYRDILKLKGYDVVGTSFDGKEAVAKYAAMKDKPDVMIMDHRMPTMSGVEATKEIKKINPDQKILFATADSTIEGEAANLGVTAFLVKPFRIDDLLEQLDRISHPR